ncbi:MAG: inorganic phosphate transporter [Spirochaetes bacterium]|nr:inorganic phosphate transporter [Spirochaetota bacterium]
MEFYVFAIVLLVVLAVSDLIVGVSNDAVNFLNSSIGSRVAPLKVIMIIAGLGILAGVTFSSGMMEVARKGIFHPGLFQMNEIIVIFLAVMLTDILLLDLYNTFGLPTSTTVSIVFELLGAAVAVSIVKISNLGASYTTLGNYINTTKALVIISGILISIAISFLAGTIVQFFTRLIFTFEYRKRLKRYGGIWGGVALTMIVYFILIKGANGASFITAEMLTWIKLNSFGIMLTCFIVFGVIFQLLSLFTKINILKPVILIGTFALAMSFAANDLVNFIGVPLAGLASFNIASGDPNPAIVTMEALQKPIKSNTFYLLLAGVIMVLALWFSKKAKTVTKTEVSLGSQDEEIERFGSSVLSRSIVRMVAFLFETGKLVIPKSVQRLIAGRLDVKKYDPRASDQKGGPSFDLLRASVNLMVASAVVSFATSMKLPLSTTYVTFMVAMGTSLSDQAWGRESAVFRVSGVLTVIGGWFLTAVMAFTVSLIFAFIIFYFHLPAVIIILALSLLIIWRNHHVHKQREKEKDEISVFNLRKVADAKFSVRISFEHSAYFLQKVRSTLDSSCNNLFCENRSKLKSLTKESANVQKWANIIIANIFKTLRLLNQEDIDTTQKYAQIINTLQEISESHRDIVMRSYTHIANNHKGLLQDQINELDDIWKRLSILLDKSIEILLNDKVSDFSEIKEINNAINKYVKVYDQKQIVRIQEDISKTRLSILYYGKMGDFKKIANNTVKLLEVFRESFAMNNYDESE